MQRRRFGHQSLAALSAGLLCASLLVVGTAKVTNAAKLDVSLAISACRLGPILRVTMTWSGATIDHFSMRTGIRGGVRVGFINEVDPPQSSGTVVSEALPSQLVDRHGDLVDTDFATASAYVTVGVPANGKLEIVASGSVKRERGGWAACG